MKGGKIVIVLVVLALVIWGVYALSQKQAAGPASGEPIKIGYIGPLTGEAASVGEPGLGGAELAVKEINDGGGVLGRPLVLVPEDDKCSADGVNAMNKLVNVDKVVAVTGPDCSSSGGPALPVAQAAKIPTVVRWASAPNLTKIGDYIFRVYPSDASQGRFIAEFVYNTLGKKKAAVIYVKNDWGQGLHDLFLARFKELGGEVIFEDSIVQDSRDIRTQLTKVKASRADVLFLPIYPGNAAAGLKQARELKIMLPVIGGDVFDAEEVITLPDAEGVLYSVAVIQNQAEFQAKVAAATGKKADKITAPMGYDAIQIIAAAIKKAGSTESQAVRDAIAQTSYQGISSPTIEFDENGDLKQAQFEIKVIKAGKSEKYAEN